MAAQALEVVLGILAQTKLYVDPQAIEWTLAAYPRHDHERAAFQAAARSRNPDLRTNDAALLLKWALQDAQEANAEHQPRGKEPRPCSNCSRYFERLELTQGRCPSCYDHFADAALDAHERTLARMARTYREVERKRPRPAGGLTGDATNLARQMIGEETK